MWNNIIVYWHTVDVRNNHIDKHCVSRYNRSGDTMLVYIYWDNLEYKSSVPIKTKNSIKLNGAFINIVYTSNFLSAPISIMCNFLLWSFSKISKCCLATLSCESLQASTTLHKNILKIKYNHQISLILLLKI